MLIQFQSVDEMQFEIAEKPYPASKAVPEWWKDSKIGFRLSDSDYFETPTFKRCIPMLDIFTAGYIIPLHADLEVANVDGKPIIRWFAAEPVIEQHFAPKVEGIEFPDGYDDTVFKYLTSWIIKTPPGYSVMITHPFGYKNLPFQSFSGIVDSDEFHGDVNTPFVIKKGFSGIIPRGTPMMQVIPFKRDEWNSEVIKGTAFDREKVMFTIHTKIHSGYKKMFRKQKKYT